MKMEKELPMLIYVLLASVLLGAVLLITGLLLLQLDVTTTTYHYHPIILRYIFLILAVAGLIIMAFSCWKLPWKKQNLCYKKSSQVNKMMSPDPKYPFSKGTDAAVVHSSDSTIHSSASGHHVINKWNNSNSLSKTCVRTQEQKSLLSDETFI
ncbi:uncharacterized protein [Anabrus simplex]|uniref:uncharacterized protein n=1 Tax=Anabrus simplex TaxID=316456 RepID=UPI0034DCED95